jgi:hypothetical protein
MHSAHLQPQNGFNASASSSSSTKHPLEGLVPRAVGLDKIHEIMGGDVNPFKGNGTQPYSANYRKILQQRKGLPVYQKMQEFYDVVSVQPHSRICVSCCLAENLTFAMSGSSTTIKSSLWKVRPVPERQLRSLNSCVTPTCLT